MYWLLTTGLANAAMAALLAAVALFVARRFRLPALAHALWALVLVKLMAPPLVRLPVPIVPDGFAFGGGGWFLPSLVVPVLVMAWLLGSFVVLAVLVSRTWRFRRLLREVQLDGRELTARVAGLAQSAGLRSGPEVVLMRSAISPMLWGVGPFTKLLFPARLVERLPAPALDALLLHELAHYARGDQWMRVLEGVARVAFWWNPLVWWVQRELEAVEEACCDAWVIARQPGARRGYAEALLATIDFLAEGQSPTPALASGLGDAPLLRERLTQIVAGPTETRLSASARATLLVAAALVLPLVPVPTKAFGVHRFQATVSKARIDERIAVDGPRRHAFEAEPSAGALEARDWPAALVELASVRPKTPITAVANSPDGRYRLERRRSSEVALVHTAGDFRLSLVGARILCAAFTPDSQSVVTGHADGQVRVWECGSGGLVLTLREGMEAIWSVSVAVSSSGGHVAAAGCADGTVVMWNLPAGEEAYRLASPGSGVSCVRWSPDGERLAICYGDFEGADGDQSSPSKLVVWSLASGQTQFKAAFQGPIAAAAWRSSGELAVADWDGEVVVLSLEEQSNVSRLSLGTDGKRIVEAAHWSADCPLSPVNRSLPIE